ncbi:ABC transporter ATP-binding protein [Actinomadura darangshiensis]|uniref:ABC transporter ATP-binding protein n=2 Tax=Actinomadura darangshiensis TaxID=705336 RepID=A0A4R5BK87_9ACTN|nr:ABC transporter ATP-binding protein [Actinomadura darangshiensis]
MTLTDVHAYIGRSHILNGVSFDVTAGQVTTIVGRNGVGKTSTLRSILGLMRRTGAIRLDGRDLAGLETHEIARLGVGYVPEDRDVFHGLTIAENLRLAERRGTAPDYDRVFELFPELKTRAGQRAGTLSGGQQQMLSLGRALLNENRLLLIDEPTKGLAPRLVREVVDTLARVASSASILLVEQSLAAARRLSDTVVVLSEGRVATRGPAAEILADEASMRRHLGVGES